ncbi:phospholipid carrier-dependent glycosyltransferase [soil metagenome]
MPLLLLFAAVIRLIRLAEPEELVFDETYYAKDACLYLGYRPEQCGLTGTAEQSYVHPPLGKWLIAAGIKLFGNDSFGWRISAVVFGVALVLVTYLLAEKLFQNRWISLVSGLLVATDFLLFVQSRIAMLDIFLAFFVALGFLFIAMDRNAAAAVRDHLECEKDGPPPERRIGKRIASGIAFGLALSVKWSAVYALAAAALLGLGWTVGLWRLRRKRARPAEPVDAKRAGDNSARGEGWGVLARDVVWTGVAFGLVPLMVYVGSYSEWFVLENSKPCAYTVPAASEDRYFSAGFYGLVEGECLTGAAGLTLNFADLHDRVADYHLQLTATHPYQSKAWTWPLVLRPVAYFYEGASGRSSEIIGMANVATWYAALLALIWLVARSIRSWRPETVVLAAFAAQYVPWLVVSRPLFFFYMTPSVPFLMIGLAAGLNALRRKGRGGRRLVLVFLVVGVGVMTVIFFPILTAIELDYDLWQKLMWIPHFDCGGLKCGWI